MSLNANEFWKQMHLPKEQSNEPIFKIATVTNATSGKTYLTFYGEDVQSQKPYKRLSSYSPVKGDCVCVARINRSWLILGKIV